jgi:molybdenum cofactor biosynthesis enzyme MoaA
VTATARLDDRTTILDAKWTELPEDVRSPQQLAGVGAVACGATHSLMERCNFSCTSCYLSEVANYTTAAPFEEARAQLDALRRHLGNGGKVQITSGEVTLLPVEQLGRIIAYAVEIGLDPMVMTNGQRFLQKPDYLLELVQRYGLRKTSIHIDTTQRGRPGLVPGASERDLHPLRDRFAHLVERVCKETGKQLHAAQTVTVTADNLSEVPEVVRWALQNAGRFRIISFLPVAEVGRTTDRGAGVSVMDRVWRQICAGAGKTLNREAMHFGHRECNITVPLLLVEQSGKLEIVEAVRREKKWDLRIFRTLLELLAKCGDSSGGIGRNLWALLRSVWRRPSLLAELPLYVLYRLWDVRHLALRQVRRPFGLPRVSPLLVVVHSFMDAAELETPEGQERLQSCVFRVPVDGEMISMCQVNATSLRKQLNQRRLRLKPEVDQMSRTRGGAATAERRVVDR